MACSGHAGGSRVVKPRLVRVFRAAQRTVVRGGRRVGPPLSLLDLRAIVSRRNNLVHDFPGRSAIQSFGEFSPRYLARTERMISQKRLEDVGLALLLAAI